MTDLALLLSVAPEFAEKIASGTKTVEIRRRFPAVPIGTWIYLYVTLPVGAICGRAKIVEIDVASPAKLWETHYTNVGLTRSRFDEYFGTRPSGVAVCIGAFEALKPIGLRCLREAFHGFIVPQSFRYLGVDEQVFILKAAGHDGKQ